MRKLILLTFLVLPAFGAIALDHTSTGAIQVGGGSSGVTFSHVIGAGTGRYLVVSLSGLGEAPVTTVTYSGVSLTRITAGGWISELWGLADPPVGTANVVVVWPAFTQGYEDIATAGISFTGVGGVNTFGSETGPTTVTVTTTSANTWLVGVGCSHNGSMSPSTSQTELYNLPSYGAAAVAAGYIGPVAIGSNTMTWYSSGGTGSGEGMALVALAVPGGASAVRRRSYGQ